MAADDGMIVRARDAIARGAWSEAYEDLRAADPSALTGADLEGLADAAWWTSQFREALEARLRAYTAYVAAGDEAAAAAVAARLSIEHFVRDEPSVGAGYLMRAHRHADGLPEGPAHGFLAMVEANVARFSGAFEDAVASARRATDIGRRFGDRGLVAMAIHTEGLALIDAGRISEGIALMDEAMTDVLGGDLSPYFTGVIYCNLIEACLGLDDVRRAGEWSDAARVWCDALEPGTPFTSMCRVNRAEVARLRGAWAEAQAEAELATRELERIEPGVAASAFLQLGEIRRRRGDLDGADEAFGRAHELGADPQPGLALLRLSQGQPTVALAALRDALDAEVHRPRRIRLLAAQAESAVAAGELADARAAVDELETLAGEAGTPAFEATAATAAGILHLAEGDAASARERLRLAVATWQELRIPYEAARARSLYGQALRADGDEAAAGLELQAARAAFDRLGARRDVEMTDGLLQTTPTLPDRLTEREAEVLRLVASGMTNRDIAVALVLSEHTVARHLQNIFGKIGVSTRAAATAYVYEHDLT